MPLSLLQVTLTHERKRKCPQIEIKEFHATSVPNIRLLIVTTPQLGVDPTTRMVCADFRACSHAQGTPLELQDIRPWSRERIPWSVAALFIARLMGRLF